MKHHTFEVGHGTTVENGKPTWPHHVRVIMDRRYAYDIIRTLITQLSDESEEWIQVDMPGLLTESKDE